VGEIERRKIVMGGSYYPSCTCQPQLDLINKFHHLDLDAAFLEHGKPREVEEIHHCTGGIEEPEYKIIHCGCPVTTVCGACGRNKCAARKMHAINKGVVKVGLHLGFVVGEDVGEESELWEISRSEITIIFSEKCPKHPKLFHMLDKTIKVKWDDGERIVHDRESFRKHWRENEKLVAWAKQVRPKLKGLFDM
jgi:hypothetical protein